MNTSEIEQLEFLTGLKIKRHANGWLWIYKQYTADDLQQTPIGAIADFINIQAGAIAITKNDI